jgi:hypothetical protein
VEYFNPGNTPTYLLKVINLPFINKGATYSAVTIGYCKGINTTYDILAYISAGGSDISFCYRDGVSMGGINGLSASSTLDIVLSFMYQVEE